MLTEPSQNQGTPFCRPRSACRDGGRAGYSLAVAPPRAETCDKRERKKRGGYQGTDRDVGGGEQALRSGACVPATSLCWVLCYIISRQKGWEGGREEREEGGREGGREGCTLLLVILVLNFLYNIIVSTDLALRRN